jgi:hypothetical protein
MPGKMKIQPWPDPTVVLDKKKMPKHMTTGDMHTDNVLMQTGKSSDPNTTNVGMGSSVDGPPSIQ